MQTEKSYKWSIKGYSKKIDPEVAADELQRINDVYGKLTAEIVVNESQKPNSPLHGYFEWDNDKAANQWRIQQARVLINNIEVVTLSDGEPKSYPAYEIVTKEEGYRHIETLTIDELKIVRESALRDLKSVQKKLSTYDKFMTASNHIQYAISELLT